MEEKTDMNFKKSLGRSLSLCTAAFAIASSIGTSTYAMDMADVKVVINGESNYYRTTDKTVADFLQNNEISYDENSKINVSLTDEITGNMRIVITAPVSVNLYVNGEFAESFSTSEETVGKAVAQYKKTKNNIDYQIINVSSSQKITDGMNIELTSIEDKIVTENVELDFDTIRTETDELEVGTEEVKVQGVTGLKKVTKKIHYVGGVQDGEPEVTEKVMIEPVAQEVLVGTHDSKAEEEAKRKAEEEEAQRLAEESGIKTYKGTSSSFNYSNVYTMNASAYAPVVACCGKDDGITASGMRAGYGVVAVDPNYIKLGTKLYVEGYGYAIAADTGGAIKGYKIDLCYNTYNEAVNYGRKNVQVYILS
jgi:3D (Asp-Asp-Asp) domain-containing protein